VSKISGTLGDDSKLATDALLAHLRQEHSNRNEDSDSGASR
jgi:hypothetical protein